MLLIQAGTTAPGAVRMLAPTAINYEKIRSNRVEFHGLTRRNQRLTICASTANNLDQYQCISRPLTSEAAMKNVIENNTLVFTVDVRADKTEIKAAMKNVFNVETRKVNTLIRPDKRKKKAFVMLKPEYNAVDVAKRLGIL
ncbi:60S ribosomal protein L23a-2 [Linum perenne]